MRIIVLLYCLILFVSCHSKADQQNPKEAQRLYSEGMRILDDRISIQSKDSLRAIELNKEAIKKFSAAYAVDTSFTNAVLFASECAMYGGDYEGCVGWTKKLMRLDTSQENIVFCKNRIQYCKKQIGQRSKSISL